MNYLINCVKILFILCTFCLLIGHGISQPSYDGPCQNYYDFVSDFYCISDENTDAGIAQIRGRKSLDRSLVIETTTLSDLAFLEELVQINGSLVIGSNIQLQSLNGLDNLSSVEGGIYIIDNPALSDMSSLVKLSQLQGDLRIDENPSLIDLTGLDNIASVSGKVWVRKNPSLLSLSGLESLEHIGETLLVENNRQLLSMEGLATLSSVEYLANINRNDSLIDLSLFSNFNEINFRLVLYGLPSLNSLTDFENVTVFHNDVSISNVNHSVSLQPLKSSRFESSLRISGFKTIESISYFADFRYIRILEINDLEGLQYIVPGDELLPSIEEFKVSEMRNLERVEIDLASHGSITNVWFNFNPIVTEIITYGEFHLDISSNDQLTSIVGLQHTISSIDIYNNPLLIDIEFPTLTRVSKTNGQAASDLSISNNPQLESVNFDSLAYVQGQLRFSYNSKLCVSFINNLIEQIESQFGIGGEVYLIENNEC